MTSEYMYIYYMVTYSALNL